MNTRLPRLVIDHLPHNPRYRVITTTNDGNIKATELRALFRADGTDTTTTPPLPPEQHFLAVDLEWPVTKALGKKAAKVAVIQLASPDGQVYLFHVAAMASFPLSLKQLLQDGSIKKVGVNIKGDATKLKRDWGVVMHNIEDIATAARSRGLVARANHSLADLLAKLCGYHLDKDASIRCSDWALQGLSKKQMDYAAVDVFATLRLFLVVYSTATIYDNKAPTNIDQLKQGQEVILVTNRGLPVPAAKGVLTNVSGVGDWCTIQSNRGHQHATRRNGITVTSERVVVRVTTIIHAGALLLYPNKPG